MYDPAVQLTDSERGFHLRSATTWALVCVTVVAACADGVTTISRSRVYGRYSTTEIQWAAGGGRDFKVVVRNTPAGTAPDGFEQKVIDAIQGQITFMITNFTTTPGESANTNYRIAFFFDAPSTTNGFALCDRRRDLPATAPQSGETVVLGALCLRDDPLTEAFATMVGAAPGTPEFDRLMSQLIRTLLPRRQPGRRSPSCRLPGSC